MNIENVFVQAWEKKVKMTENKAELAPGKAQQITNSEH